MNDYYTRYTDISEITARGLLHFYDMKDSTDKVGSKNITCFSKECGETLLFVPLDLLYSPDFQKIHEHYIKINNEELDKWTISFWFRYYLYNAGIFQMGNLSLYIKNDTLFFSDDVQEFILEKIKQDKMYYIQMSNDESLDIFLNGKNIFNSGLPYQTDTLFFGRVDKKGNVLYHEGNVTNVGIWNRYVPYSECAYLYNNGESRILTKDCCKYFFI